MLNKCKAINIFKTCNYGIDYAVLLSCLSLSDNESHLKKKALTKLISKNVVKNKLRGKSWQWLWGVNNDLPHTPGKTSSCHLLSTFQCDLQVPK